MSKKTKYGKSMRYLFFISAIVFFGNCKKTEYRSVYADWVGDWELEYYSYGGFQKLSGGGSMTKPFSRYFQNDSFKLMSSYFKQDSPGQFPYLVYNYYHQPAKCIIHSKLNAGNVLSLSEDYTTFDAAGNIAYHWTFSSEIQLQKDVYEYGWAYSSSGKPVRQWVYKDGVLSFFEETSYPGSGGGTYYKMSRKFRKTN